MRHDKFTQNLICIRWRKEMILENCLYGGEY